MIKFITKMLLSALIIALGVVSVNAQELIQQEGSKIFSVNIVPCPQAEEVLLSSDFPEFGGLPPVNLKGEKATSEFANDIAILADPFPYSQVPITQNVVALTAKASNVGSNTQTNIVFSAAINGTNLGSSAPIASLAPGATSATMTVTPTLLVPLGANTLTYTVTQNETDDDPSNNTATRTFTGTGNTFATDNGTMASFYSGSATYGTIYTFTQQSTLFQTAVYFYVGGAAATYTINIFEMTGATTTAPTPIFTSDPITRPTATA